MLFVGRLSVTQEPKATKTQKAKKAREREAGCCWLSSPPKGVCGCCEALCVRVCVWPVCLFGRGEARAKRPTTQQDTQPPHTPQLSLSLSGAVANAKPYGCSREKISETSHPSLHTFLGGCGVVVMVVVVCCGGAVVSGETERRRTVAMKQPRGLAARVSPSERWCVAVSML